MKIAIFGLGYVGSVSAACFCELGHEVIGVDTNTLKVNMINQYKNPVLEPGLQPIIKKHVEAGSLLATEDVRKAVEFADISLVCVGTPSLSNGQLDSSHVENVFAQIGSELRSLDKYHVVALRSTLLPDAFINDIIPKLIQSTKKEIGKDFGVAVFPEFLREGTAIADFFDPPKIVIGEYDERSGNHLYEINKNINAPMFRTDFVTAGMVKYVDNCYHALKIGFANEVGRVCTKLEIDSHKVMDIFCSDRKLNISTAYLKPGFAFGGSCLPKDVRAISYKAKQLDVEVPLLSHLMESNSEHIQLLISQLVKSGKKRIGFLGLAFKEGTDDLRESPIVEVIERMIGKGFSVSIFDENVKLSNLIGANRAFIQKEIPHIGRLIHETMDEVIEESEILVISQKNDAFVEFPNQLKDQIVIDLVGVVKSAETLNGHYSRFC